jgi:membrane protein implicated in regulation of membrane protease activity
MLLETSSWWASMEGIEKVYWSIAIISSLLFLIIAIMTFVGGDVDGDVGDVDADIAADDGIGFQFFTFKNLVGFFTIFSWTGLACLDAGLSTGSTVLISVIAGTLMMVAMATLFYMLSKLTDSGTMQMKNAIGHVGEVYLPIEANRGNKGKVQIKVQGSLRELPAITDDDEDLLVRSVITVVDIIGDNTLLVSKSKK